ncbi:MAG: diguanylate cyclase [Erythrobacter sp.]
MEIGFSATEGAVLHGLFADATGDIVVRLDVDGFIEHASENISALGYEFSELLIKPHIADLASLSHAEVVREYAQSLTDPGRPRDWIEFPIQQRDNETQPPSSAPWYALNLRSILSEDASITGALGLLRTIDHRRVLENELHASTNTDALTGLCNRNTFRAKFTRQANSPEPAYIALVEVSRFRAICLQYGQRASDDVVWAFAQFLQTMAQPGFELAYLEAGRFGVILPNMAPEDARNWCEDALETFAALAIGSTPRGLNLSANAGLSTIRANIDETFKDAELALVMAGASGGMRVGISGLGPTPVVYRERPMVTELGESFAAG